MTASLSTYFAARLKTIERHGRTLWLGQSVDTSVLHAAYPDYSTLPILTSVGCVMRRPKAVGQKFDGRLRERLGANGPLTVDSGGFVLMMKLVPGWDAAKVADLYNRIDADHLISLDVPPNPRDRPRDRHQKYQTTIANLAFLVDRVGPKIVPVVHGTTLKELDQNCRRTLEVTPDPRIVGIGGLVPTVQLCGAVKSAESNAPQRRIVDAVACVRSHFPKAALHLFGVGSLNTVLGVLAAGVNSVDSIGWRQAAGFGSVFIPGRHRRLLTNRDRERPCRPFASAEDLEVLARCLCPECRVTGDEVSRIERLTSHFKPRAAHNIWVLYEEVAAYLDARDHRTEGSFLQARLSDAWLEALDGRCEGDRPQGRKTPAPARGALGSGPITETQ